MFILDIYLLITYILNSQPHLNIFKYQLKKNRTNRSLFNGKIIMLQSRIFIFEVKLKN